MYTSSRVKSSCPRLYVSALVMLCGVWGSLARADAPASADTSFVLTLGEQRFDPLVNTPQAPADLRMTHTTGPDLHLVQLAGPTSTDVLDNLRADGLEVIQYIHPYTYVVWGETDPQAASARDPSVRWSGPFLPAYRLLPPFRDMDSARIAARALVVRAAQPDEVVRRFEALGAKANGLRAINDRLALVSFDVPGELLPEIARIRGVYSVRPIPTDAGPRGEMSNQVNAGNIDPNNVPFPGYQTWLSSLGLSGAGVIMANVDSGVQEDHADLINRMIPCVGTSCGGTAASNHGTLTAAIMAADGASGTVDSYGFLRGLGMAPGAQLVEQLWDPFFRPAGGLLLLMRESYENGALLSSNSWGTSGTARGYDDDAMQVDVGVRDVDPNAPGNQPFCYVLSIMNGYGGTSSQGSPDEAKNCFTLGSTRVQTLSGAPDPPFNNLSSNSGHGPALDGRKIPHMVAPGCYVDSCKIYYTYGIGCGTSMAAPHASGAIAVFIDYYRQLPGYTVDPSPALIKAAFLPVAHDLAGYKDADGLTLGHPFDSKQGWGRLNVQPVVDPPLSVLYFDAPTVLDETGAEWVQTVRADDPNAPLRVMLVWTDAPGHGLGGSTPAWNNDLDLVVENATQTYYGNDFGPDGWSQTGGSADGMNNTEGFFAPPTTYRTFTLRVQAANINSDGVPGVGDDTDQDFALVCYNCVNWVDVPGDMNCDGVVDFGDINPFVTALVDGEALYQSYYPNCEYSNADVSENGSVGFDDINPFVAILLPE